MLLIIIIIVVVIYYDRKKRKAVRCDGCQEIIKGKFIRVTEDYLTQSIDYCSTECKEEHHEDNILAFAKKDAVLPED